MTNLSRRRALALFGGAALLPMAARCGGEGRTIDVTVMLDWVPNTNHTGLYVAKADGHYAAERLNVTIVEPGTGGVESAVGTGAAQFGVSFQEQVTLARVENVPVVSIAAIIQHNTSGFASPVARNITRPKDFEGKKYGSFGSDIERQVVTALMQCDGGDYAKIQQVDIGATDPFVAWARGDVDFIWIFEGWTGIEAKQRGVQLNFIRLNELRCVPDYYTPVIIAGEKIIADQRNLVQRFVRATARGYQSAIDEPAKAAETLIKSAQGVNADLVRESQAWLSKRYAEGAKRWGEQKLEVWTAYGKWMFEQGLLKSAIDPSKAFEPAFIDKL